MKCTSLLALMLMSINGIAQSLIGAVLPPPDLNRGMSVMQALSQRASASEFDTTMLPLQDISDLLWAANGINRPESGKRTAPTAVNAQEIDVYLSSVEGIFLYEHKTHSLKLIAEGDFRKDIAGRQDKFANAPIFLILVADLSRFPFGDDQRREKWASMDAGIVSQNISVFCAGTGLSTRPRATMETEKLHAVMKLGKNELLLLNHPVGR